MRNPNDPIPGFPEYTGTVRYEKRFHKTHFDVPGRKFRSTRPSKFVWVEVKTGRWKLIPREEIEE